MTMAERIDYLDDPAAPKATSVVPSANVIAVNGQGEILLIRRTDNGNWAVPGGGMDLGESIIDTAVRETREETGITCEITGPGRGLHQPPPCDSLHQQQRGPAGVLDRLHRQAGPR
jgi:8-oxo-dGTP pyrophosphatase MutT (NUDIX family)